MKLIYFIIFIVVLILNACSQVRDSAGVTRKSIDEFQILDGVPESIKMLKEKGFVVIVITNQSAINRGLVTIETLNKIHNYFQKFFNFQFPTGMENKLSSKKFFQKVLPKSSSKSLFFFKNADLSQEFLAI